jgi:hypothetical protein
LEPLAPDGRRPWRYGGAVRNHPFDVVIIFLVIGPLGGELVIRHDIGMIDDRNGEDRANLS